jgi:hypothetical protein
MVKPNDIDKVISVCTLKDISVWPIAAEYILNYIDASEYEVIVPEKEVLQFRAVTPNIFRVVSEELYVRQIHELLKSKFNSKNIGRYGWYLQQFIKLAALMEAKDSENYLIWDADTVPLKPLTFTSNDGFFYYKGNEYHSPYFQAINQLLGLEKIVPYSFIAQCFPVKGQWMHEFRTFVERRNNVSWLEAIVQTTNFQESSGFSEYETLGTFFSHKYPDKIHFSTRSWLRFGNSALGGIENLHDPFSKFLLAPFDHASFEVWDKPGKKQKILRGLASYIYKGIHFK